MIFRAIKFSVKVYDIFRKIRISMNIRLLGVDQENRLALLRAWLLFKKVRIIDWTERNSAHQKS